MTQPQPHLAADLTGALTSAEPPRTFAARAERIEHLEAHVLERLQLLGELPAELRAIAEEARAQHARLTAHNARFVQRLAGRIAAGAYTRAGLRAALGRVPDTRETLPGFDALDELFAELLDAGEPSQPETWLEPEMVSYQPTPARVILALVERAALSCDDVLCDLGSGLGHVVLGAALLSGVRGIGVELEPTYCAHAASVARRLRLPQLAFMAGDARDAPLDDANVFYLYTPFRGKMLAEVLERLRAEAEARPIVVCSYGPCSVDVARCAWLAARDDGDFGEYTLCVFDSVV